MILLLAAVRALWRIILCVVTADFVSGLVHWWEDTYGKRSWPILGRLVIKPNIEHHARPRSFLAHGVWKSIDIQVVLGLVILAAAYPIGWLSPELALVVVLMVAANVTHRWAHATARENGPFISSLQRLKLVQSRAHHGRHHARGNSAYCAITPWLDPLLDRMHFWRVLERIIARTTGIRPVAQA